MRVAAHLASEPADDRASRGALVAGRAPYGAPPAGEAAVPDARSAPDTAAYLLAVTLADAEGGAARAVTDAALLRLEAGQLLSVVE